MEHKKTLSIMTYYTLIGIMVAFAVFFGVFIWTSSMPLYAQIMYIIVLALLVGVTILDIISVNVDGMRGTVGYILYVITLINIICSFVFYGLFSTNAVLTGADLALFTIVLALSYGINVLAIIIYAMGNCESFRR